MRHWQQWSVSLAIGLISWGWLPGWVRPGWAEVVRFTLLQLNDIYEITAIEGGTRGGLARVATVRQRLVAENPHTYTILAGDALSPSALGTARINGESLAGQQMVAVMNAIGFDLATFGNHEFDLNQAQFLQRLQESKFQWISSNVSDATGQPFPQVERSRILTIPTTTGNPVRVGVIGLTIDSNPVDYVRYQNFITAAQSQVKALRSQTDLIIAITHLSLAEDQQLAAAVPELALILGGHEHENIQQWRFVLSPTANCPNRGTPILKADANARSVYIHQLEYDTDTQCLTIHSRLQPITAAIPEDPTTAKLVQSWLDRGFQAFRAQGFQPETVVATIATSLDGLETSVRNQPTNLTQLIAEAMLKQTDGAELAIFNSGAIRIDDRLPAGAITQYDMIRILPFGGQVLTVELPGSLLQRVLNQGQANRGTGGYLQTANVSQDAAGNWLIQGQPLQPQRRYRVAIADFLMTGREQGLNFLNLDAPGVKLIAEHDDIRFVLIRHLQTLAPSHR
ncbi:bifunctional metallophosphatase/5'-nucleotidase [Pantanalinema rosaneae CENA516]|uniref:bifunctional metallophosphatase/5'-nucleotidase n=1 Tax=Pantanalinema rosaneae TaxID=1620701 RepID=UPI003D6EE9E4